MHFVVTIGVLLGLLLFGSGCGEDPYSRVVYIQCDTNSGVSDKIDLAIFEGIKPGIQVNQARSQFGEPKRIWQEANGTVYYLYQFSRADVAVAKETQISGGVPSLEWWTAYAFPKGTNASALEELLSPDVLREAGKHKAPYQLIIQDPKCDEGVWCKVTSEGIVKIRWLNALSKSFENK